VESTLSPSPPAAARSSIAAAAPPAAEPPPDSDFHSALNPTSPRLLLPLPLAAVDTAREPVGTAAVPVASAGNTEQPVVVVVVPLPSSLLDYYFRSVFVRSSFLLEERRFCRTKLYCFFAPLLFVSL